MMGFPYHYDFAYQLVPSPLFRGMTPGMHLQTCVVVLAMCSVCSRLLPLRLSVVQQGRFALQRTYSTFVRSLKVRGRR